MFSPTPQIRLCPETQRRAEIELFLFGSRRELYALSGEMTREARNEEPGKKRQFPAALSFGTKPNLAIGRCLCLFVALTTCISIFAPCRGQDKEFGPNIPSGTFWRRAENDGLNCLYFSLLKAGYNQSYEQFIELAGNGRDNRDLLALSQLASKIGYQYVPVRLTTQELERAPMPIIIQMINDEVKEASMGNGRFCVDRWFYKIRDGGN